MVARKETIKSSGAVLVISHLLLLMTSETQTFVIADD